MLNAAILVTRYRRLSIWVSAVLFVSIVLLNISGAFSWVDSLFYDLHFKVRGARSPSGKIVLVYMDESSAAKLHRHQASWSRSNMAHAIDNLTAAGSEIIALDMIFSAPAHDQQQDLDLAQSISTSNNVVLARVAAVPGLGSVEALPLLQQGMIGDGFIDLPLDTDNYLRKVRFLTAHPLEDGTLQLLPAFSLEIVRTFLNLDYQFDFSHQDFFTMGSTQQQQLHLPYPELLINYYGTDSVFTQLNYADVVNNTFDKQLVAGKIILIGSKLKTEKDVFNTPFTRYHAVDSPHGYRFAKSVTTVQTSKEPGLACHAHAIETILNQTFITTLSTTNTVILLLIFAIVGHLLLFRLTKTWLTVIQGSALILAILTICQLAFQAGLWITAPPLLLLTLSQLLASFALLKIHEKQRSDWVTSVFGKYVSASVVERLVQGQIAPNMNGQTQQVTVLFADLRAFTTISEQLNAQQTTQLLNTFFAAMIPQIQNQQGTVDKLIGDAIMAFFGAPVTHSNHAQQAALAALQMVTTLQQLKQQQTLPGLAQLEIGIGINSGDVTVGNLGCEAFMNYTVIGDTVNLASRIEGLNKVYGSHILLAEQTVLQLDDTLCVRELDRIVVKGKNNATTLFELVGFSEQLSDEQQHILQLYATGLALYRQRQWQEARQQFNAVLELNPADRPSQVFIQRIDQLLANPPDDDWDGITRFMRK